MEPDTDNWIGREIASIHRIYKRNAFEVGNLCRREAPLEWAVKNISFSRTINSPFSKYVPELTPYLSDIFKAWEFDGKHREVTVCAPEQTGKSLSWILPLLWTFCNKQALSLVIYPSDEMSERMNSQRIKPLMQEIPDLAGELAMPRTVKKDCYNFAGFKSYFMGAGSRVTSVSAKIRIADEIDDWTKFNEQVFNLDDLRKRARIFPEGILHKCCTPTMESAPIWQEFLKSSRGYWHLRCCNCSKLSIRSCDLINLQWECDSEEAILPDSIRLFCPDCGHPHEEKEHKQKMTLNGAYIHEQPNLVDSNSGFQWGALACQFPSLSWYNIAQAQIAAGKTAEINTHIYLDNSIKGLPYKQRRIDESGINALKNHFAPPPKNEDVSAVLLSADTQDDCFFYAIRAYASNGNSWLLDCGKVMKMDELNAKWQKVYCGQLYPALGIIDSGGHRLNEVAAFVRDLQGFYLYKGNSMIGARWKFSNESKKLILANPKIYQAELLYYLYSQKDKSNNFLFLPQQLPAEYTEHITDLRPNKKLRFGHEFKNWEGTGNDHLFDCEKMLILLHEIYRKLVKQSTQQGERRKAKITPE